MTDFSFTDNTQEVIDERTDFKSFLPTHVLHQSVVRWIPESAHHAPTDVAEALVLSGVVAEL